MDAGVVVGFQLQAWSHRDRRREPERPRRVDVLDVDLRVGDRCELVLSHCPEVVRRDRVVHELLEHDLAAHAGVDHGLGHLALPETRDPDLARHLPIGSVEVAGELLRRDLHRQLHDVAVRLFERRLHRPGERTG